MKTSATTSSIYEKDARIRELIRYLICEKNDSRPKAIYSSDELLYEIINLTKCDENIAIKIHLKMYDLGLSICKPEVNFLENDGTYYDIVRFAKMRGYVTEDEIADFYKRQERYDKKMNQNQKELDNDSL